MKNILVIGSFMMDLVVRSPRAPETGETIIGSSFARFPGGKGANQAVAAARLGAHVTMAGKLGKDGFGDEMLETLDKEKINTQFILRDETDSTGVGFITLEQNGSNRIIVVPGANLQFGDRDLEQLKSAIQEADLLMMQLEMDLGMTEKAVAYAHSQGTPVMLNPAPARKLSDDLFSKLTYLTPNETEAEILTGIKIKTMNDAEASARALLAKGVRNVIITLAEKGALIAGDDGFVHVPGFPVTPVDTVAAGDAFNGALAVGIINGKPLVEAVRFANAVGALAVTKEGAIPSLPDLHVVEDFIRQQGRSA